MFQELKIEGSNIAVIKKVQYILHTPDGVSKYWQSEKYQPHYIENGKHLTFEEEELRDQQIADLEKTAKMNAIGIRGIYRVQGDVIVANQPVAVSSAPFLESQPIYFGDRAEIYTFNGRSWSNDLDVWSMVEACMGLSQGSWVRESHCRAVLVHNNGVLALNSEDYIWSQGELTQVSNLGALLTSIIINQVRI